MATIKAKIRISDPGKSEGIIFYQIIHNRTVRRISSGLCVPVENWDAHSGSVVGDLPLELKQTEKMMERHVMILRRIVMNMEKRGRYSADDVVVEFEKIKKSVTLGEIAEAEIRNKRMLGKYRTAEAYCQAVRRFFEFYCGQDVLLYEINTDVVESFQSWLFGKGLVGNSVSFYMRNLRCIYNRAVRRGLVYDSKPFAVAYTGVAKTRKRAIRENDLKKISMLDLSGRSAIERSRDYFMLSFYCMGMSFVDMAYLKKSALKDGRITYQRSKTGQTISFSMNSKISRLVKKYASAPNSPYLLDIIDECKGDGRKQYKNAIGQINRHLKVIGGLAGINVSLTSYVSRHTWASIAKMKNVGISTISDALGHENESTTHIYLSLLDTNHIDRANNLVIKGI